MKYKPFRLFNLWQYRETEICFFNLNVSWGSRRFRIYFCILNLGFIFNPVW